MHLSSRLRMTPTFLCFLAATSVLAQDLPGMPLSDDAAFWGAANKPYTMQLTVTYTPPNGNATASRIWEMAVQRDSSGRMRTDSFYNSGRPMSALVRDPRANTTTILKMAEKSASVLSVSPAVAPPPGKVWTVERLPPRVIAGFPVEGFRFTRTIPARADGTRAASHVIDEEWVSNKLNVVLEQTVDNSLIGRTTATVSHLEQAEPDPALFAIPKDYSVHTSEPPTR